MITTPFRVVNLQKSFGCALEPYAGAYGLGWVFE